MDDVTKEEATAQQCQTASEALAVFGVGLIKNERPMILAVADVIRLLGLACLGQTAAQRSLAFERLIGYIDQRVTVARLVRDAVTKEVKAEGDLITDRIVIEGEVPPLRSVN